MKITYVAPRFHTNQIDTVKGWLSHGDQVQYISYYTSPIEDYTDLKPTVLGFSVFYRIRHFIHVNIVARHNPKALDQNIMQGMPPVFKLKKALKAFGPDVVILRERSLYSIVTYRLMKNKAKCILYNQSPLWDDPLKTDLAHKIVYALTPRYRYTPVMGNQTDGKVINEGSRFLPFVINTVCSPGERSYFDGDKINILAIGVFETRKNHRLMVEVFDRLIKSGKTDIHLTLIGEASQEDQKDYLAGIYSMIEKLHLGAYMTVLVNQSRQQVYECYKKTDLFVIPSAKEPASVSQLEAMSCSVPVICTKTNGSACYVIEGYNGCLIEENDADSLYEKLNTMLENRANLCEMGANAYNYIKENNSFEKYYEGIMDILKNYE